MAVITSQILDISSSSTVDFRQWANNTNKIVSDVTSVNSALVPIVANVNTLKTTTNRLTANVVTLNSQISSIGGAVSSPNIIAVSTLSSNGLIVKVSANSMVARTITGATAGVSITNGNGVAGNPTIVLANDLAAIEALAATGIAVRTAVDTWAQRTIAGPAAGISVTNGSGVSGNPTLGLANDLAAIEGLAATGIAVRTADDTWAQRTIAGPTSGISVSNGSGVAGNPTIALANDLAAIESLASTGFAVRTAADAWAQRSIGVTAPLAVTNADGVAGNPALTVAAASNTATGVIQVATRVETISLVADNRAITPLQLNKSLGVTIQAFDANTVKSNASRTLTAGFTASAPDLGTTSSGTWTPNMASGNFQLMRNGGAFTIAPPANDGSMVIYLYNSAPGAVTFSGWHKVIGDTIDVVVGHAFYLFITNISGLKVCNVQKVLG
jgi:hypothetical protein